LDNKNQGRIILIMQRLHEEDPAGHFLAQGGWTHLNLPAIAEESQDISIGEDEIYRRQPGDVLHPERESREKLKELAVEMGTYAFAAQYQQSPTPQGGGIIHWDWFQRYTHLPNKGRGGYIVQSWDTVLSINESSSYSVCTTWFCYQQRYYLFDVWRQRLEFPDLLAFVQAHAQQHNANLVFIEANNCSIPLIETLRLHSSLNLAWMHPQGSKAERMIGETGLLASGRVLLPEKADWLTAFRNEMIRFPMGKHDDQVDSLSQFLWWVRNGGEQHPTGGGFRCFGRPNGPMGPQMASTVTVIESDPGPLDFNDLFQT
jgi:predicted phage terminase large subunit-like protein